MSLDAISGYGTDWWTSQMSGQAAVARRAAGQEGAGAEAGKPGAANQTGEGESFHVTLSGQTPQDVKQPQEAQQAQDGQQEGQPDEAKKSDEAAGPDERKQNGEPLSEEEKQQVEYLKKRDQEVRAHEMAHVSVGGSLVKRGAMYEYESGPDGKRYAVGGDVILDVSEGRTPEETIRKAERVRAAAMAPADPSPQDYKVASQADKMAAEARAQLREQQAAERAGMGGDEQGKDGQEGRAAGSPSAIDEAASFGAAANMAWRVRSLYGAETGGLGANVAGQRIRAFA